MSNDTDLNLFDSIRENTEIVYVHYDGCPKKDSAAPLDVCACSCYDRIWFELGRKAEKDLFYGGNDRG